MKKNGQNSNGIQQTTGNRHRLASGVNLISKGKHSAAVWAMNLYQRLGLRHNIHIRRLHYHALLQDGLTVPSGKAYRNTTGDYEYLKTAFDQARLLGLIPYDVFSDTNRFSDFPTYVRPALYGNDIARRQLLKQMIEQACRRHMTNMFARIAPVHIEVWLEQTGTADIVAPLAARYHLNIVTSRSEISLTNIWRFVRRIGNASKPVRILYITDFDPKAMSSAAIDKVTTVINQYGLSKSVDLKIIKIALDHRECKKYDLPSAPGSEKHESNPTELHALEVAVPGFLCSMLEKQINKYFDCRLFRDAAKQTDESIARLMVEINRKIDENQDIYEVLEGINFMIPRN